MSQSPPHFSAFATFSQVPTFLIKSRVLYAAEAVASIYSEHPFFFPLALSSHSPQTFRVQFFPQASAHLPLEKR